MKKALAMVLAFTMVFSLCVPALAEEKTAEAGGPTDYSDKENWYRNDYDDPEKKDAKADVIFFNGTSVFEADYENGVGDIDDKMKSTFQVLYDSGVSVFDDGTRMYAPYYRQVSSEFAIVATEHNDLIDLMRATEVKDDIFASLDYYFDHYNEGRPFIIAGQSQGGAAVQIALEDYFGMEEHRAYLDNMVAAYSVAYGVDKNWLEGLGYLKFAEGAFDTGVVISWDTEGPGEKEKNFLLAENPADTLVINPINWKTDGTYADASLCSSSLVDGEIVEPGQFNLQIDPARGSVICDNCEKYVATQVPTGTLWGGKSLHTEELALAYGSIRKNMHDRIDAFLTKSAEPLDYSQTDNWMLNDYADTDKTDTQADVIFFYGTESAVPTQSNGIAELTDEVKEAIKKHCPGTVDAFDDGTRMYSPYYRQVSLASALEGIDIGHEYLPDKIASTEAIIDLSAALDYYFENYNEGRPFIIAGFSQGGACVQAVLEHYFGQEEHTAYLDRLVAAYSIAYGVDKTWLDKLDYIDFATGADDTGVLLSWVTEGPGAQGPDMLVADDPANALVINPINWTTDGTPASAEECLGTYVDGEIVTPGLYNLQFSEERGCLICDNNTNYISAPGYEGLWGGTSLHVYEVSQAYASIRANMHDRIDAFMKNSKIETTSENYDIKPLAGEAIDYSESDSWLMFDESPENEVDLFYIYPTVVFQSPDETGLAQINDEHRAAALNAYNGQGSAFADYTNVYAPMYRQACIDKALSFMGEGNGGTEGFVDFLRDNLPRTDIYAALDYYFNNVNNGRPFILAGHSQGSSMSSIVLSEYFRVHPELLERMVACYAIGFPFSDEWLSENPHLKFATGETDTNCIISWNTEGPGAVMANACIGVGKAYNINPLNWKTDETYADASENLGSLIDGELIAGFGDAQIDSVRGALICTTYDAYCPESMSAMMGDKSLHTVDYQMYYANIKENAQKRIDAYMAK